MSKQIIQIENKAQWLNERLKDITSTEVSALYGLSPYISEFELFHQKREGTIVNIDENERMKWGTRLESAIAHGAAEDNGWEIEKFNVYMRDNASRMGSSFDFKVMSWKDGPMQGVGILEIKNVDSLQYARNWTDDGEGNIEAPDHIELQIQHQMEVADLEWTALVPLVGGNTQKLILRKRDRTIGADIAARVQDFWQRVADNNVPTPDYTKDADFIIKQLHSQANANEVMIANKLLEDMIKQYAFISKEASDLEKIKSQVKAEIMMHIGTASKVTTSFGSLSCGTVKASPGKLVTPDMVGQYIGARESYRNIRFYPLKEQ